MSSARKLVAKRDLQPVDSVWKGMASNETHDATGNSTHGCAQRKSPGSHLDEAAPVNYDMGVS